MRNACSGFVDFFLCRGRRRFARFIVVFIVLFIIGNYFLLKPLGSNSSNQHSEQDSKQNDVDNRGIFNNRKEMQDNVDEARRDEDEFREIIITPRPPETVVLKHDKLRTTANQQHPSNKVGIVQQNAKTIRKKIALLVIACNRIEVRRCLDKIFEYLPKDASFSVIVSQDCGHQQTADVIRSYGDKLELIRQPELGPVADVPPHMNQFMGYYKISRHYKWALSQVFKRHHIDSVVIVEDDIDIAPDFFEYFLAGQKLMDMDNSIFCISAWNDNGKEDCVDHSAIDILYRSDFFPGLGWMMTRKIWEEIGERWPKGFWDDWMRDPKQRNERACIRPEISRTKTFGRVGVSRGQFYDQYLKFIKLNSQAYPFSEYDMSHLTKSKYDEQFLDTVYGVPEGNSHQVSDNNNEQPAVRITYRSHGEFEHLARSFGIMTDFKAGVPRTAYKGVVTFYKNNKRVYIAPPRDWKGYTEH